MRLSILIPFNLLNYVLGGTSIKIVDYIFGTIGTLPLCFFYVYIGTTVSNFQEALSNGQKISPVQIVVGVIGTVFAVGGIAYISWVVRKKLKSEETTNVEHISDYSQ